MNSPSTSATIVGLDNRTSYNFIVVAITNDGQDSQPAITGTIPSLKARADWYMTTSLEDFEDAKEIAAPPFDWEDDSCGGSLAPDTFFAVPCDRHDFGYRNYGKGIQLQRDESTRLWIDRTLLSDMLRQCTKPIFLPLAQPCVAQALSYYFFVRVNTREDWNRPI